MRLSRPHALISLPEIAEATIATIGDRNSLSQATASRFTAVTNHESHDLACAAAQCRPHAIDTTIFAVILLIAAFVNTIFVTTNALELCHEWVNRFVVACGQDSLEKNTL